MRHTWDLIRFNINIIGASLDQMLGHVTFEIWQQFHFFIQNFGIISGGHVGFFAILINKMYIAEKIKKKQQI